MKKVTGQISVRALGCPDDATDEEIQKMVDDTMELSWDYQVEDGYEEYTETKYWKRG